MIKKWASVRAILIIFTILLGMVMPFPVYADPLEDLNSEKLAVSLVIDTSGSMTGTDPDMLRRRVADIFIEMLNPDDYLGMVVFHSEVTLAVPPQRMESQAVRDSFRESIQDRLQGTADTDYAQALLAAENQLDGIEDSEARKLIIFLTDGRPDPDPVNVPPGSQQMESYMDTLWTRTASIGEKSYPVYSIGFSEGIDVEVLNRIAEETGGDVRIYRDAAELDQNLIQILGSREEIIQELLAPAIIQEAIGKPVIQNEFWPKRGGYRIGESETVVASIRVGNRSVGEGPLLQVDQFNLVVEKSDGVISRLPLYDDGGEASGDIMAGDGRWTTKWSISSEYSAKVYLEASGLYREEIFNLKKDLGEIFTAEPGNVRVEAGDESLWVRTGETLTIPLTLESSSPFAEVLVVQAQGELGELRSNQIEIGPETSRTVNLYIDTIDGMEKGIFELGIIASPLHPLTSMENNLVAYQVETVGFFGNIVKSMQENLVLVGILGGVFILLPLAIFLLGNLFYLILIAPATKIRGTLQYWKDGEEKDKREFNLKERKKSEVRISMDIEDRADFNLNSTRYSHDIIIGKKLLVEGKKFILGWKKLFSNKTMTVTYIKTTLPGIMNFRNDIYTEMNLYDGMEFTSGDYQFKYSMGEKKWSRGEEAGKDFLEGRTNGF
ncbi:MAG: VWA domain-containing protein [Gudongella sp.]|nr:VWA domain-containing protein [Gudongella sp.]